MIDLKSDKKEFELIPEGNHLGRLYSIVELGSLPSYKNPGEFGRKVMFTFELPDEMRDFAGETKPMVISFDFFISMYKTSQLRKAVEGIAGKLSDEEADEFDLKSLLGRPCMVNVVHNVSASNGRTYANIASITPLPKAVKTVPEQVNPSVFFSYGDFDQDAYNSIPAWVQKKMAESQEMKAREKYGDENEFKYPERDTTPDGIADPF